MKRRDLIKYMGGLMSVEHVRECIQDIDCNEADLLRFVGYDWTQFSERTLCNILTDYDEECDPAGTHQQVIKAQGYVRKFLEIHSSPPLH